MTRLSFAASRHFPRILAGILAVFAGLFVINLTARAQQPAAQPAGSRYDITNYRIEAQLIPEQHMLRAGAEITFCRCSPRVRSFSTQRLTESRGVETGGKPLTGVVRMQWA